jgi:hypothetical protein
MMRTPTWTAQAAGVALVLMSAASTAQAQVARFSKLHDAVPSKYFDATLSKPDPSNPNRLIIGFAQGLDPVTFAPNDFRAWFGNRVAMDTITFKVTAPAGFYVAKLTYTQHGAVSLSRTLTTAGGATWVVNNTPASLGAFTTNPDLVGTADLTTLKLTSVPVSITESLFASVGAIMITDANLLVKLLPLP